MTTELTTPSGESNSFSDLWDGFEIVCKSSEKGVIFLKDIQKFFKKRATAEDEYAKSLAKLAKLEMAEGYIGTKVRNTWGQIRAETLSHSTYHEQVANAIAQQIVEPIEGLVIDLEQKFKTISADGQRLQANYSEVVGRLRKAKTNYDKLCKEAFEVSGVTKGETQKVQKRAIKAAQDVVKADREYRATINDTNTAQRHYLVEQMPKVMGDLQRLETVRIHMLKQYFIRYFSALDSALGNNASTREQSDVQSIMSGLNAINVDDEIHDFIRRNKTHDMPRPFEYEPYVEGPQSGGGGLGQSGGHFEGGGVAGSRASVNLSSTPLTSAQLQQQLQQHSSPSQAYPVMSQEMKAEVRKSWNLKRIGSSINMGSSSDRKINKPSSSSTIISPTVFNQRIEDIMVAQKRVYPLLEVPIILVLLKQKLLSMGAFRTQGIFRVPGNINDINSSKKRIEDGNYDFDIDNVCTVASLLKLWLRDIPDSLIPISLYDKCMTFQTDQDVLNIFNMLPITNQKSLSFVLALLQHAAMPENVEVSMMGTDNLAMVFSPCLLRSPYSDPAIVLGNLMREKEFVKILIDNHVPLPIDESADAITPRLPDNSLGNMSPPASPSRPISSRLVSPLVPSRMGRQLGTSSDNMITPSKKQSSSGNLQPNNNTINNNINQQSISLPSSLTSSNPLTTSNSSSSSASSNTSSTSSTPKSSPSSLTPGNTTPPPKPSIVINNNNSPKPSSTNTPSTNQLNQNVFSPSQLIFSPFVPTQPDRDPSFEIMSPSEVKKRASEDYSALQEEAKRLIDDTHAFVNQLYSDLTTAPGVSAYASMKSSHSIFKFTNTLEQHLINVLGVTRQTIADSIDRNNFISPPCIHFKVPTSLPRITPDQLAESSGETLRLWLQVMTLIVNRANQYLCFLGGIVMRMHSPETLRSIIDLLRSSSDSIIIPSQLSGDADRSLTVDQADLFIQKTIQLFNPIIPYDIDKELINHQKCKSPNSFNQSNQNQSNQLPPPPQVIINDDDELLDNQHQQQQQNIDNNNLTKQFEQVLPGQITQSQKSIIKNSIIEIISKMNQRKQRVKEADANIESQQNIFKLIAKQSMTIKRDLDQFVMDNGYVVMEENNPVSPQRLSQGPDAFASLRVVTTAYLDRIILVLHTLWNLIDSFDSIDQHQLIALKMTEINDIICSGGLIQN